jgi:AraC-like DNA-binding protein
MMRDSYYISSCRFKVNEFTIILDLASHTYPIDPWSSPTHCHENWEIHYITAGKGILRTNTDEYEIRPGIMFITGPGIIHTQECDPADPMEEYGLRFTIIRSQKHRESNSAISTVLRRLEDCHFIFTEFDFDCIYPINQILAECTGGRIASSYRMQNLLTDLLISTARCIGTTEVLDEKPNINRHEILELYMRTYKNNISVEELSKKLHISSRQLRRIISDSYSSTMTGQKNRLRIETARRLLKETDLSIAEIAEETGFNSPEYFSRCFKKMCGVSPDAFRKSKEYNP